MNILFLFLGLFWIMCGIGIKVKKYLWIHQGLYKRPVDVDKYTNYMGIVDMIAGICCIILGFLFCFITISDKVIFILSIIYCTLIIYGEAKYRIKLS